MTILLLSLILVAGLLRRLSISRFISACWLLLVRVLLVRLLVSGLGLGMCSWLMTRMWLVLISMM